jgi:hypothetical protein
VVLNGCGFKQSTYRMMMMVMTDQMLCLPVCVQKVPGTFDEQRFLFDLSHSLSLSLPFFFFFLALLFGPPSPDFGGFVGVLSASLVPPPDPPVAPSGLSRFFRNFHR